MLLHLGAMKFSAFAILAAIFASKAFASMSFQWQEICVNGLEPRCQKMILAEGKITKDTPAEFKEWSRNAPKDSWVAMSSPGGSVIGGMQLGQAIRLGGFNTTIAGSSEQGPSHCLSACAYAYLGGTVRYLPANAKYGLHQYRGSEKAISSEDAQKLNAIMGRYVDFMGVDRRVLDYAQLTSSDKMTVLSQSEAKKLRVDNFGQSLYPKWRLELVGDGRLLIMNTANLQGKLPISLGFTKVKQSIVGVIYYKSSDAASFSGAVPHSVIIDNQKYPLTNISSWQEKTGGYQLNFEVPNALLIALSGLSDESTFTIQVDFSQNPKGIESPAIIRFGSLGLKNAIAVLTRP